MCRLTRHRKSRTRVTAVQPALGRQRIHLLHGEGRTGQSRGRTRGAEGEGAIVPAASHAQPVAVRIEADQRQYDQRHVLYFSAELEF